MMQSNEIGIFLLIVAAVLMLAAYLSPHKLVFRTASGNQQALSSRNKAYLFEVKGAVEEAVHLRG